MRSLVRYSPQTDMRTLQREMDRLFDRFFPAAGDGDEAETAVWTPRADLAETEDAYLLELDLPGVTKEDLSINYQDGDLTVSGERKAESTEEKPNYVRMERTTGHFFRSFALPKRIDTDGIEARYDAGVLHIRVPKAEESRPRRIKVS